MNEYELLIGEVAVEDVNDIILWYKEIRNGLENNFVSALQSQYNNILIRPDMFGFYRITPQFRYVKLKRFPYYILYKVDGYVIRIVGIIHTARSPKFIRRRYR